MEKPYIQGQWVRLPISRACPTLTAGCLIAKAHSHLSDSIEYLIDALSILNQPENVLKRASDTDAMMDVEALQTLKEYLEQNRRLNQDLLCAMATECPDVEMCRC